MRRGRWTVAAVVACGLVLGACGGGEEGAASKEEWLEEHEALVNAYSRDLVDAVNVINQGERQATVASCTQVNDDAREVREEALPVPNAAVNTHLTKAVEVGIEAAQACLRGARETNADAVEEGQRLFAEARKAMDEAEAAIDDWV
ncbi:MAG: hypothetical protein ACLGI2_03030 [Acidimicrobiia bacterium]